MRLNFGTTQKKNQSRCPCPSGNCGAITNCLPTEKMTEILLSIISLLLIIIGYFLRRIDHSLQALTADMQEVKEFKTATEIQNEQRDKENLQRDKDLARIKTKLRIA